MSVLLILARFQPSQNVLINVLDITCSHKLQPLVDYVLLLGKMLEKKHASIMTESETSGLARRLKKMLVDLNDYDNARDIARTFHLKEALWNFTESSKKVTWEFISGDGTSRKMQTCLKHLSRFSSYGNRIVIVSLYLFLGLYICGDFSTRVSDFTIGPCFAHIVFTNFCGWELDANTNLTNKLIEVRPFRELLRRA